MDRRSFFKVGGAIAAAGLTGSCGQVAQKIIPYVVPPDEGINPVDGFFYATTCRMCEAGCGIMVRTVDGRAKKIEGNPNHPVNEGGVCARGQAAVQQLYHPERLRQPMKRVGGRGSNKFAPIAWDEALSILARNMEKAGRNGAFVMATDPNDLTSAISARLVKKLGYGKNFCVPNINGKENYRVASESFSLPGSSPYYDISQAAFVLLLGADIFENGFSPVHYGLAYGRMRRAEKVRRGMMVYAGPRVSSTASLADEFIAARPGELGILAMGVASGVLEEAIRERLIPHIPMVTLERWKQELSDYSANLVARRTGVAEEEIAKLAERFVKDAPAIAVAGDGVSAHTNALDSLKAVEFLNMLSREIGREKKTLKPASLPKADPEFYRTMKKTLGVPEAAEDYSTLAALLDRCRKGDIGMGLIINSNPVHSTPASLKSAEALSNVEFVASFGCFLNDTTRQADLVLPDHHFLESWSAQVVEYPCNVPMLNLQQPVVGTMYDTRSAGDVLIEAAKMAGIDMGVENTETMVKNMITEFRGKMKEIPAKLENNEAWEFLLRRGGWWPKGAQEELETTPTVAATYDLSVREPLFTGASDGSFYLHPYITQNIWDGRNANLPWLLEMPEPMTTLMWGAWVEVNPKTARRMGVKDGDILELKSEAGTIELPTFVYPGIGPDTVAIPFGFGHESFGKYASGRGANAMDLLGGGEVSETKALAWRGVRVKVRKTGKYHKIVRAAHPEGEYLGEVFQL